MKCTNWETGIKTGGGKMLDEVYKVGRIVVGREVMSNLDRIIELSDLVWDVAVKKMSGLAIPDNSGQPKSVVVPAPVPEWPPYFDEMRQKLMVIEGRFQLLEDLLRRVEM